MRYLVVLLAFTSCAPEIPERIEVDVEHRINVEVLIPYIEGYCREIDAEDIEQCVNVTMGELLRKI